MTDTREQVERIKNLIARMVEGEGFHADYDRACGDLSALRALLSHLEAAEAERDAVVGAAMQVAAKRSVSTGQHRFDQGQEVGECPHTGEGASIRFWTKEAAHAIRSITPADAQTALDRVKAEEREDCATMVRKQADEARAKMDEARVLGSGQIATQWATISAHLDKAADTIREGK